MPSFNLHRPTTDANRIWPYRVLVNGKVLDTIAVGGSAQLELPTGEVEIICKLNKLAWCRSNKVMQTVKPKETLTLVVSSRFIGMLAPLNLICALFAPHRYLRLEAMSGSLSSTTDAILSIADNALNTDLAT